MLADVVGIGESVLTTKPRSLPMLSDHNPRYFPEPESYNPSRWAGKENDPEALPAFSLGTSLYTAGQRQPLTLFTR